MRRMTKHVAQVLGGAVLLAALSGCGAGDLAENIGNKVMGEGSGSGEMVTVKSWEFDKDSFSRIKISTQVAGIQVIQGSGDKATVAFTADRNIDNTFTAEAAIQSDVLNVQIEEEDTDSSWFSTKKKRGERRLTITLPEKQYRELAVDNKVGGVEISGTNAEGIQVKTEAGGIVLQNVSGKVAANSSAGNIRMADMPLVSDVSAKTEAGNIDIQLSDQPEAARLELSTDFGKVTSELDHVDYLKNSRTAITGTIGSKGPLLRASTEAGSVKLTVD